MQYDGVCKFFSSSSFFAYSRGVKAKRDLYSLYIICFMIVFFENFKFSILQWNNCIVIVLLGEVSMRVESQAVWLLYFAVNDCVVIARATGKFCPAYVLGCAMLSCFWQSIKHNLQYDRVCKSFRSLFFIAYSRGVKAKWLYSPNVTTLWEYFLRNLKSLILCYYFMRMLFVRDFSKCWSLVERLKLGASRLRGWSSVLRDWEVEAQCFEIHWFTLFLFIKWEIFWELKLCGFRDS